jgi:cell wall-associated NlpC family hydrolase
MKLGGSRFGPTSVALAIMLVLGGCGTPSIQRSPVPIDTWKAPSRLSPEQASDVTIYAVSLVGTPYRYAGNTPDTGFDCSGLIGYVYQTRGGVMPPRTVAKLQGWGQPVSNGNVRSGDVVLFAKADIVTHAGIYVGGGRFVHAPSTGGVVRLDYLSSKYWAAQQVAYRRP